MMPLLRTLSYSESAVRLICPFRVQRMSPVSLVFSGSKDVTGMAEVIFSSGLSATRLTTALPRDARPASGIS